MLGRFHTQKENYELANNYFRTSILYAKSGSLLNELTEIYESYSELANKQGNADKAYDRLQQHLKYKDSLYNITRLRELQNAQIKFEVEEIKHNYKLVEAEKHEFLVN